jgi:hypothetical protein
MRACRLEALVPSSGVLQLTGLPFSEGESVEVIVLERAATAPRQTWQSLKGSVLRYDRPTDPVAVEDWDALK